MAKLVAKIGTPPTSEMILVLAISEHNYVILSRKRVTKSLTRSRDNGKTPLWIILSSYCFGLFTLHDVYSIIFCQCWTSTFENSYGCTTVLDMPPESKEMTRADRLAGKAIITGGLRLGMLEVLRSLRHYMRAQSQGYITPPIAWRRYS